MADVANGQIVQVTLAGELSGSQILNTFHYKVGSFVGPGLSVKQMCDLLNTELNTNDGGGKSFYGEWLKMVPPQYTLLQTWIQVTYPTRIRKEIYDQNDPGTWPVDGHWANSAACITRKGELAGRKYISSLHVPIASEIDANAGLLPAAFITQANSFITQILYTRSLPTVPANLTPVIPHKTPAGSTSDIKSATAESTVRVMRRRTKYVGV